MSRNLYYQEFSRPFPQKMVRCNNEGCVSWNMDIGHKHNKKTVLTSALTQGDGSSEPRVPYEAMFPKNCGNLCVRHVARPRVIKNYFKHNNKGH